MLELLRQRILRTPVTRATQMGQDIRRAQTRSHETSTIVSRGPPAMTISAISISAKKTVLDIIVSLLPKMATFGATLPQEPKIPDVHGV